MEQTLLTKKQAREQGLKHYFTGKACKRGHVDHRYVSTGHCCSCVSANSKKWASENPEKRLQISSDWKKRNPDMVNQRRQESKERQLATSEGYARYRAVHNAAGTKYRNSEKGKASARRSYESRIASPTRLAANRIRTLVTNAIKRSGSEKAAKTEDLLGCTVAEARAHLEAQFLPGMTWDNHGEWHIDHIRPCASFDFSDPQQQKECSHYSNLQPLWAKDNLSKSDKWEAAA